MGLILTRSPYHVSRRGLDAGASLQVKIGRGSNSGGMGSVYQTYQLSFRNNYFVDISSLIASEFIDEYFVTGTGDYFNLRNGKFQNRPLLVELTFDGFDGGVAQTTYVETHYALDGYLYNTDPHSHDFTDTIHNNGSYAGSSDVIYKLDDAPLEIPRILLVDLNVARADLVDNYVSVALYKNGELLEVFNNDDVSNSDGATGFSSDYSAPYTFLSFQQRVEIQNGIYERNKCIEAFLEEFKLLDVDKVIISNKYSSKVLTVNTIEACKYSPYKLIFKNRFGVKESLWFFKKSKRSLKVTSEDFRANQLQQRIAGVETAVDNTVRSMQQYNKNGVESVTLNSGFVVEALNESFKQLMLSEEVTLFDYDNNVSQAVNVKNGEFKYKTSVNDKLINYSIDLEMSNNIIDDIA